MRHFLVSASVGAVASGNAFFNHGGVIAGWLKSHWTGGAIVHTAVLAIARHRNLNAVVTLNGCERRVALSNLSVMKTQYLSGSFRFDTPVSANDGLFTVNLLEGMRRVQLLGVLAGLHCGRSTGRPGWQQYRIPGLRIESARPFVAEMDGEVIEATRVEFEILSERIRVCR